MGNRAPIVYRSKSSAVFIDMAAAPGLTGEFGSPARRMQSTIPEHMYQYMPWAPWGTNNLLPQEMKRDIETCGVLNAILDGKARFALCEGIVPAIMKAEGSKKVVDEILMTGEVVDWLEMNNAYYHCFALMKDQYGMGNAALRLVLNGGKDKVHSIQRDDITEIRYEKQNETTGKINHAYHSACWEKVVGYQDNRILKIPLLDDKNPLQDLRDKAAAGIVEMNYAFRQPAWGNHYYTPAQWYAALKWVKIAQGVPEMKAAMFENNMRIKYEVVIYKEYWSNAFEDWDDITYEDRETRRNELFDEIDAWLVGSANAYKSIYVDGEYTLDGKAKKFIEVNAIEDNTKPGELLPDSAAANSEIAIATLWNNAMTGGNQKSGLYGQNEGGSSVREASTMQVIVLENERRNVVRFFNMIKYFNGWHEKYPGLEFIIPGTILTTLDTGGSSKPVITGGSENKKEDGTDKNDK